MSSRIKLSTGKTIYAHQGVIGISDDLCMSGGYDDAIVVVADYLESDRFTLTREEQLEVAKIAIDRWTRFIDSLQ